MIKVYGVGTMEYQKLRFFANMVNSECWKQKKCFYVDIKDIYFDYGADWKYTALVTEDLDRDIEWQSLCPRDYENLLKSDSFNEIMNMALDYANNL